MEIVCPIMVRTNPALSVHTFLFSLPQQEDECSQEQNVCSLANCFYHLTRSECKPSDPGKQGVKQGENKGCKEQWSLLPWLLHTCQGFLSSYSHPLMTNEIQTIHFKEVCTLCLTFPMTYVLKIQKVFFQYGQPALHASFLIFSEATTTW